MKCLIAGFIFVLIVDLTVYALCKAAKKGDKTLKNPEYIKIRSRKY